MTPERDQASKANPSPDAAELRRQAEATARQEAAQSPESLTALSPAEMRQTLHELRVHQIELEIQNEELRRAQVELDAARGRYFDLYDLAPVSYLTLSESGLILEANLTAATLLGVPRGALVKQPITRFIHKEDEDLYYLHRKQLSETGAPQRCELRLARKDGTKLWAHLAATAAQDEQGAAVCRVVMSDITERKRREEDLELTSRLILLVNTPGDFHDRMADLTVALQGWSGCEAVGIRLRAGDDYPYYMTRGFPPAFVRAESRLCAQGPGGETLHDSAGHPVLECMCGNILSGRFDPSKPFFTAHGSFWSNSTTALLASTTEADRQARTRNRCNSEGYESVALIPLRVADEVFGLLQFNDHRPNCFTADLIAYFERIADSFAIALWRRQAEEKLLRHQQQLELAQRSAGAGLWDWDIVHGQIEWSRELFVLFGLDPDRTAAGFEVWHQAIHPEDRAHASDRIDHAVKEGTPLDSEYRVVLPGESIRWIHALGNTVYDQNRQPLRMSGICLDITERKRAAEALLESDNNLRAAEQIAHLGYWSRDRATGESNWSNETYRIFGVDPNAGKINLLTLIKLFHPEDRERVNQAIQDAEAGIRPYDLEYRVMRPDGTVRWIYSRGEVRLNKAGLPERTFGIVLDITERKQMEEQVLRSQRMESIGSLAGGIAHDLNNILAPVLLAAPFLREEKDERERNKLIDTVESCAQRGADTIKQLLTFARGQPGARAPIPARLLLNEMGRLIRETFPRNIQLSINSPKDLWPALGDATQFHQTLMNLCVNARDAMPGGGALTLGARNVNVDKGFAATALEARPGAYVCVSVADTGTGIAPENLHRIFDPFFTTKEIGKGTGLGLASLLGIVRGHKGFIRVDTQPGNGTTFELYFPALPAPEEPDAPEREEPPPRGQGELILIVDDEPAISQVVALTLKRYGYRVLTAGAGEEALAVFTRQSAEIKAVITDMMMPGIDGPKLVQALRQLNAQLPIIGMTGLAERVDIAGLEALNLAALLNKPFAGERLLAALHQALVRRAAQN